MNWGILGLILAVVIIVAAVGVYELYYSHTYTAKSGNVFTNSSSTIASNTISSPTSTQQSGIPAGEFVKVSNQDYAPPGKILVVEQSWIGCPVGAAASWAIYNVLKNYGNLSYEFHYSDPYRKPANVPGLLFTGFNSTSILEFYTAYIYNEYMNASYNGTPIPDNQLVPVGEQILKEELQQMGVPNASAIAQIIIQYETEVNVQQYGKPSAFYGQPPHLNFGILISGPNGTYIVTTPIVNNTILVGYSPQYVFNNIDNFSQIISASQMIQNTIIEAAGPLAPECPT